MRIAIIGPGIMPIPPVGWGAVENLIHEYSVQLEHLGCEVLVVNVRDRDEIVRLVNGFDPDFVHCQYDEFADIMGKINCPAKAITSHFGYVDQVWKYDDYVTKCHEPICRSKDVAVFALSPSIAKVYADDGVASQRIFITPNGVNFEGFHFEEVPKYPDKSIYLGKVDYRKRQGTIQKYDDRIDFVGNICEYTAVSSGFHVESSNYLGEWSREMVYGHLTDYANLILLSDGEAHALVCMEALAAGLGLVISEFATANLDLSKPYIDVIPEDRMSDGDYVAEVIRKNREISILNRQEIREYAKEFSWKKTCARYLSTVRDYVETCAHSTKIERQTKPSVAIVTIATGEYFHEFFEDFKASVFEKFSLDMNVHIHCFTDTKVKNSDFVSFHQVRHMGWPFDTLLRFNLIYKILPDLMKEDFILYMDSDMRVVRRVDPDLLFKPLVAVRHPGFIGFEALGSFEILPSERAYVPKDKRQIYVQGCFWGGQPFRFKHLILTILSALNKDLSEARIPVWHDESYLNWYMSSHSFEALSPAYAHPEGWEHSYQPIVIHRSKEHNKVRGVQRMGASIEAVLNSGDKDIYLDVFHHLYLSAHKKNQELELSVISHEAREQKDRALIEVCSITAEKNAELEQKNDDLKQKKDDLEQENARLWAENSDFKGILSSRSKLFRIYCGLILEKIRAYKAKRR